MIPHYPARPKPQNRDGRGEKAKWTTISRHLKFSTEYHAFVMTRHLTWWKRVSRFTGTPSFCTFTYQDYEKAYAYTMGRKRGTPTTANSPKSTDKPTATEWANFRLTADDAPIITEDANDLPALCHRLAAIFLTGSDFSIRYNPTRTNYSGFIISPDGEGTTNRIGISAFGPDIPLTLAAILYKFELYQQDPDKFSSGGGSLGFG